MENNISLYIKFYQYIIFLAPRCSSSDCVSPKHNTFLIAGQGYVYSSSFDAHGIHQSLNQ